jgi:hypothetical protein
VTQSGRNVIGVLAPIVAGYIALAIAATIDSTLSYPGSYETAAGEMLLRLSGLWPFLFAAAVIGVVAALILRSAPRPAWLLIVGVLAAGQYALALRYVAPEWQEWLKTIIALVLTGAVAACAFSLVARRYERLLSRKSVS